MLYKILTAFISLFIISSVHADGVSLNQNRIIYQQSDSSQMAQIHNDTNGPLLVQASIIKTVDGEPADQFLVTPPLFRVESKSDFAMRIVPNNISQLPVDRESVFFLKTRALPPVKKETDGEKQSLVFVTAFIIKVIYRPDGIKVPDEQNYKQVSLKNINGNWVFDNPTPYYMTLVGITIDNNLNQGSIMIAPFSQLPVSSEVVKQPDTAEWYFVNDYGANTDKFTQKNNNSHK